MGSEMCIRDRDNGRLADVGSHSELIKTSEIYKDIYESQLKGNE